jgi:hypothetical protein
VKKKADLQRIWFTCPRVEEDLLGVSECESDGIRGV